MTEEQPFGTALARDAVRVLKASRWFQEFGAIVRAHRDYTGHGLFYDRSTGSFFLARSYDGLPDLEPYRSFTGEQGFTEWFARQSDLSMSGYAPTDMPGFDDDAGNQRVTRAFLRDHIAAWDARNA